MPLFRYKALTETGKKIVGVVDADSYSLAKERLRKDKILVTKLSAMQERPQVALNGQRLLSFTRELGQLLNAGLPLYEGLITIEEKYQRHRFHSLFLDLCDRLKRGEQLSTALKQYPQSFDTIYISMIQAGEKTGSLAWVFGQLHQLIERRQKLKKQLISAMTYPALLGSFCLIVVTGLLLFIIPSMGELFEGRSLHPLTQAVLSLSHFLQKWWAFLAIAMGSLTFSLIYFFKYSKGKNLLQKCLQKTPIIKTILLQAALIRFCRSCSILLFGGVALIQALKISRKVMRHSSLEEAIELAEKQVIEGSLLSQELKKSPQVPSLIIRMLSIAEETGKFPQMLQSLAEIYDQELERNLSSITTFLQPALLLILGGIIGLVILSILLPLTDVSSLVG